jgi:4-hydroxythreonine-4-phosphate dehydrogenase
LPVFAVIDDAARLEALAIRLGFSLPIIPIESLAEATGAFARGLPVLHRKLPVPAQPGKPEPRNAPAVIAAIDEAADLTRAGAAAAMVTNPIHKAGLYAAGFTAPGHTEYLAAHFAKRQGGDAPPVPVMLLAIPGLRVVPVSIHLPLAEAIRSLTTEKIVETGSILAKALREDFGCAAPRLAVAALNPHAGEAGTLGREEQTIIAPACAALRAQGLLVEGPLPADTLFHDKARPAFDAVLCMYHDQALIPLKTLDFARGVNVTLGLPIIRTSPDHGTAFDIAGTGKADPSSLIEAIKLAAMLAKNRGV